MNVALGLRAHSGWAALVVIGARGGGIELVEVVDRRRLELVPPEKPWAKQPYHAAEDLEPAPARALVERGIEAARRCAVREIAQAVKRAEAAGHRVVGCAVLTGTGMPDWTVDEILAVHFRMHKAEGELFRDVLAHAATVCGTRLFAVPEKGALEHAEKALGVGAKALSARLSLLGKAAGPPWGKDQKEAALAAMVALHARGSVRVK